MATYREEFVSTQTSDSLLLDGALIRPAGDETRPLAVVWVHGFTGMFYEPFIVAIGRTLAAAGYAFVSGNNRGHHCGAMIARTSGEPLLAGGWWEHMEQAPHDVAAWIDWTAAQGFPRVVLVGHSLGAFKVPMYQAQRQDPRVAGLILASPPLGVTHLLSTQAMRQAETWVAEGRGQDLLPWGSAGGDGVSTVSANTFLSGARIFPTVYGDGGPQTAIAQIRCPIFALYGTDEPAVGTAADLETIRRQVRPGVPVETQLFAHADHLYSGQEAVVASALAGWLDTVC